MYLPITLHLSSIAATDAIQYIALDERVEVYGARIVDADGIAADTTNYVEFKVYGNDGATEIFQWSTLNTADGALTAGSAEELVSEKVAEKAIFDAGVEIKVSAEKAASGKATNAVIVLNCRPARKY